MNLRLPMTSLTGAVSGLHHGNSHGRQNQHEDSLTVLKGHIHWRELTNSEDEENDGLPPIEEQEEHHSPTTATSSPSRKSAPSEAPSSTSLSRPRIEGILPVEHLWDTSHISVF